MGTFKTLKIRALDNLQRAADPRGCGVGRRGWLQIVLDVVHAVEVSTGGGDQIGVRLWLTAEVEINHHLGCQ